MHRSLISALAAATLSLSAPLLLPVAAQAAEVAGVKIDETVKVAGKELKLNGAGVRVRAIFKVYTLALYLPKKETTAEAVLASPGPRRFVITTLRDLTGEEFGQAFMAGINANSDKAEKSKVVGQVMKFGELFTSVGNLKKGDALVVDWVPDKGTCIELNGKSISEPLPDLLFYNALLKIWLGDKPVDSALKGPLLGAA